MNIIHYEWTLHVHEWIIFFLEQWTQPNESILFILFLNFVSYVWLTYVKAGYMMSLNKLMKSNFNVPNIVWWTKFKKHMGKHYAKTQHLWLGQFGTMT
jgi:hypothetical protein